MYKIIIDKLSSMYIKHEYNISKRNEPLGRNETYYVQKNNSNYKRFNTTCCGTDNCN